MTEEPQKELSDEEIIRKIEQIGRTIVNAEAHYHAVRQTCIQEIANIQKQCKHSKTTYYPDPSGNNDSYFTCNICRKEARRL